MKHFIQKIISIILLISFSISIYPQEKEGISIKIRLSPAGSFQLTAPLQGTIKTEADGNYSSKGLSVELKDLQTGLDLRDQHTKEKLQYKQYPSINVSEIKTKGEFGNAKIKIMNTEKDITFKLDKSIKGLLKATFSLSLKDYGIKGIKYLGVGVKNKVVATIYIKRPK